MNMRRTPSDSSSIHMTCGQGELKQILYIHGEYINRCTNQTKGIAETQNGVRHDV